MSARVARILRLAGAGRSAGARIVRGAVSDCYEALAGELLARTADRAVALGLSDDEVDAAVADRLRLAACEAALAVASKEPAGRGARGVRG